MELYKAREKSLHERANMISSAKEEGREEGREEGIIEIAEKMLRKGMAIELVSELTGLNEEEVRKIQKSNAN